MQQNKMFSTRDVLKLVVPLLIQQVLAVTVSTVDSMMVAAAGEAAVSGVSLVSSLDVLLVMAFTSITAGGSVVVSQYLGQKNREASLSAAKQLLYSVTAIAALVTVLVVIFRIPLLNLLFGDVEADVMYSARRYFFLVALSFPMLAIEGACSALMRAMGNSFVPMLVSFGLNVINVGGNALFILGFGLGSAGAALSTLISRCIGAVVLILVLHNRKRTIYLERLFHFRPDFKIIRAILGIGIPNGIENSMFQFGKLLTQSLISSMGTAAIAANAVANTLANYQYMPGTAFSNTMVTVVGQCIGAKEKEQAKRYARVLTGATYLCLWVVILFTFLFARPIIGLYDLSAEGAVLAHELIIYHAICAAVMWPIAFTLPSSFRAASDVKFPLIVSMFSMWTFRVALSYYFALETVNVFGLFTFAGLGLGPMGVWIAMTVDWVFRTVLFLVRHFSGKWLTKYRAHT